MYALCASLCLWCAADGLMVQAAMEHCGIDVPVRLRVDSSAAKAIATRQGIGKLKFLEIKMLWLQKLVKDGKIKVVKEPTDTNIADIGTKPLAREKFNRLCEMANFRKLTKEACAIRDGEAAHVKTVGGKKNVIEKVVDYKELLAIAINLGCLEVVEAGGKVMDEDGAILLFLMFLGSVILALFVGFWIGWKVHSSYVPPEKIPPGEFEGERQRSTKRWRRRFRKEIRNRDED